MEELSINDPQDETKEWSLLNASLRQHGHPAIDVSQQNHQGYGGVFLECESSRTLRKTVYSLLQDCDGQQQLIEKLIATNKQLRTELADQMRLVSEFQRQTNELLGMMEKTEDKEDVLISERCQRIQERCDSYAAEMERMRASIERMRDEDERSVKRQNRLLLQLQKQAARESGGLINKLADIIDSYERQLCSQRREMSLAGSDCGLARPSPRPGANLSPDPESPLNSDGVLAEATPNFKAFIMAYQQQLEAARKYIAKLDNEKELLKLELGSRPTTKDLRTWQTKAKKLEQMLKSAETQNLESGNSTGVESPDMSAAINISTIPSLQCRQHLQMVCQRLGVTDLKEMYTTLDNTASMLQAYPILEQFAEATLRLTEQTNLPAPSGGDQTRCGADGGVAHTTWCDKSRHCIMQRTLPILKFWASQLAALGQLRASLSRLIAIALPWRQLQKEVPPLSVTDLIRDINAIITDEENAVKSESSSSTDPQAASLRGVIHHFQRLFDVADLSGMYARMNDVYKHLGESQNVLKVLRDVLGLEADVSANVIVKAVSQVCLTLHSATYQRLTQLLDVNDLNEIAQRLKEHDEFFSEFHDLMQRLLEILSISRMDQVIPAVQALLLLAAK